MKLYVIKKLIDKYGDMLLSDIIKSFSRPHLCPKCNGVGYTQKGYDVYPKGLPDSGWASDMVYKKIDCDLCQGHGYTVKEYKPIIKTEIIGYQ